MRRIVAWCTPMGHLDDVLGWVYIENEDGTWDKQHVHIFQSVEEARAGIEFYAMLLPYPTWFLWHEGEPNLGDFPTGQPQSDQVPELPSGA